MEHQETNAATKENVEIIEIKDAKHDKPHYLLLETKESSWLKRVGTTERWMNAEIEITARYLFGPLSEQIGKLVCSMGGKTTSYDSVKITNGEVMVKQSQLRGLHIGTFMFARMVTWAKTLNSERKIVPISMYVGDARDADNKNRRNTLYERFGIVFIYREVDGIAKAEGVSDPKLTVHDLIERKGWDNIRTCRWLEGFHDLARAHHKLRDAVRRSRREANVYRKEATKFTVRVKTFVSHLRHLVKWPLAIGAGIVGFSVGKSDLTGLWTRMTSGGLW